MKAKLETVGIPFKQIDCYGSQLVITAWSLDAAEKWAILLGNFCKVRGIVHAYDEAKENKGTCLRHSVIKVVRVFARITGETHSGKSS